VQERVVAIDPSHLDQVRLHPEQHHAVADRHDLLTEALNGVSLRGRLSGDRDDGHGAEKAGHERTKGSHDSDTHSYRTTIRQVARVVPQPLPQLLQARNLIRSNELQRFDWLTAILSGCTLRPPLLSSLDMPATCHTDPRLRNDSCPRMSLDSTLLMAMSAHAGDS